MGKNRSTSNVHLYFFLTSPSFRFAGFPYGFGAAEGGFKGMKPWEEEHERKNERERSWSSRRRRA